MMWGDRGWNGESGRDSKGGGGEVGVRGSGDGRLKGGGGRGRVVRGGLVGAEMLVKRETALRQGNWGRRGRSRGKLNFCKPAFKKGSSEGESNHQKIRFPGSIRLGEQQVLGWNFYHSGLNVKHKLNG